MDKIDRIKELIEILNKASRAYYAEDVEIMSNFEYDKLYDELLQLEQETGVVLSDSPTQKVGYEVVSSLPKEPHPSPMLSLDKTKEVSELQSWLGVTRDGVIDQEKGFPMPTSQQLKDLEKYGLREEPEQEEQKAEQLSLF